MANRHGRGRGYTPQPTSGSYGCTATLSSVKLLLSSTMWCAGGDLPIEVRAPLNVETACYVKGNNLLVHFLNYGPMRGRLLQNVGGAMIEEAVPVRGIVFVLKLGNRRVKDVHYAEPGDAPAFTTGQDQLVVSGVTVETHCIVVVELDDVA